MPKLIEVDAPQALQLPRETAATQGADQAVALGQIGKGSEYMGRALMSYQSSTAKSAATDYRMKLRSLQRDIEQQYIDERQREDRLFDSRRGARSVQVRVAVCVRSDESQRGLRYSLSEIPTGCRSASTGASSGRHC